MTAYVALTRLAEEALGVRVAIRSLAQRAGVQRAARWAEAGTPIVQADGEATVRNVNTVRKLTALLAEL